MTTERSVDTNAGVARTLPETQTTTRESLKKLSGAILHAILKRGIKQKNPQSNDWGFL